MLESVKKREANCLNAASGQKLILRDLLRYCYNLYSQIAHNKLPLQIKSIEYREAQLSVLYGFINSIILITCSILIDNKMIPNNSKEFQALKTIIENPPNAIKIFYNN